MTKAFRTLLIGACIAWPLSPCTLSAKELQAISTSELFPERHIRKTELALKGKRFQRTEGIELEKKSREQRQEANANTKEQKRKKL